MSKVSSFKVAGSKLTYLFFKHLKLGLKTIPHFNTLFSTNLQNVKNIMQRN